MSVYHHIVKAIDELNDSPLEIKQYLQSLKQDVKGLRASYRKPPPVYVNYALQTIQSAYLITYMPHYYHLIYKILVEQDLKFIKSKKDFSAVFIGGGPGSEAYGTVKYLLEYCPNIQNISIDILDINASTWNYSHSALIGYLLPELKDYENIELKWNSHRFDLVDEKYISANKSLFENCDLVVIQNCINEISEHDYEALEKNVLSIFRSFSDHTCLLMIDLTTSIRSKIEHLEKIIESQFPEIKKITTCQNRNPSAMTSINFLPSQIIKENLLDYSDGLIPRKNLQYDFSLLSKKVIKEEIQKERIGITAIYDPLNNLSESIENLTNYSFVGIDFGTSCSVLSIAYVKGNSLEVELLEIEQKDHLGSKSSSTIVPTIMGIVGNTFLLGKYAQEKKNQLILGKNGWYGFKQNILELENIDFPNSMLYDHPEFPIKTGADALIVFFKRLKSEIDRIVITKGLAIDKHFSISTPADYGMMEKDLLEKYLIQAGFDQGTFSFVEEPISALLGTIYQENLVVDLEKDLNILVIDVGAGTVDCLATKLIKDSDSILAETLAIYRNKDIGGNLINRKIAVKLLDKDNEIELNDDFILKNCEEIKLQFCRSFMADSKVRFTLPELATSSQYKNCQISPFGKGAALQLSYFDFNQIMEDYFYGNEDFIGFKNSLEKTICNAKLNRDDFDFIIISGGGAKNPYLRALCASYFDADKIVIPNNSQEQVGLGNAIQSFVTNAFGKQLIESMLNGNIYIIDEDKHKKIFKKGDVLPTLEYEINIQNDIHSLELYSEITNENIHIKWDQYPDVLKVIIKVNQESRIICNLVTVSMVVRLKPIIIKQTRIL